jgi:hypothetical protein
LFGSRRHEAPESRCKTILTRPKLPVGLTGSISVPPGPEERSLLLPMQPLEEFLETSVRQDCCHRTEGVPKLVMTPSLVDEIPTGMARRHDLGSAFAARHHVMSTRQDLPFTERGRIGHRIFIGSIPNHYKIENGGRSGNRTHDRSNRRVAVRKDLSRRCPRLCRTSCTLAEGTRFALAMG